MNMNDELKGRIKYMLSAQCKDLSEGQAQLLTSEIINLVRSYEEDGADVIEHIRKQGDKIRKKGTYIQYAEISTRLGDLPCWVKVEIKVE